MNITISFDVEGYKENEELVAWLNAAMTGKPVKVRRTRKPREPMTDEEKAAFRARMVKGQEKAAKAREEEDTKSSESTSTTKKPVSKPITASKKVATEKPKATQN